MIWYVFCGRLKLEDFFKTIPIMTHDQRLAAPMIETWSRPTVQGIQKKAPEYWGGGSFVKKHQPAEVFAWTRLRVAMTQRLGWVDELNKGTDIWPIWLLFEGWLWKRVPICNIIYSRLKLNRTVYMYNYHHLLYIQISSVAGNCGFQTGLSFSQNCCMTRANRKWNTRNGARD